MKAVFFDRDNTLVQDTNYMHKVEDLCFFSTTIDTLKKIQELGYALFIVTNQSGIGRGYFDIDDMNRFNTAMTDQLAAAGIKIKEIVFCPHTPEDKCDCRKPHPKMINELCEKYNIDKKNSFMIGDKKSDAEAGINAGLKGVQLSPGDIHLIFNYIN